MFFKYSEFKKFLCLLKTYGEIIPLNKWNGNKAIILRHDVDCNLNAAYKLALIEKEYNICSTFFVMVSNSFYNPLSSSNRELLIKISQMGFEIGLHFDPLLYTNSDMQKLKIHVDFEANILSTIINRKVESISFHKPRLYNEFPEIEGYNNAYNKEIFSDESYLSDSCMNFRNKDPFEFIKKAQFQTIQILLHPMHYSEDEITYPEIFSRIITEEINNFDNTQKKDNHGYAALMNENKLLAYFLKR